MTIPKMVDRVALAIGSLMTETGGEINPFRWVPLARVAIEAMREPTEAMIDAIDIEDGEYNIANSTAVARAAWQAAIDEALK